PDAGWPAEGIARIPVSGRPSRHSRAPAQAERVWLVAHPPVQRFYAWKPWGPPWKSRADIWPRPETAASWSGIRAVCAQSTPRCFAAEGNGYGSLSRRPRWPESRRVLIYSLHGI